MSQMILNQVELLLLFN